VKQHIAALLAYKTERDFEDLDTMSPYERQRLKNELRKYTVPTLKAMEIEITQADTNEEFLEQLMDNQRKNLKHTTTMESKIKEYLISQAVLNEDGTQKRFFFAPIYKAAKACLLAKKFGNPLSHGYNSCQMVGKDAGRLFHFGGEKGMVFSFVKPNPALI